jgi:hypothetical protein
MQLRILAIVALVFGSMACRSTGSYQSVPLPAQDVEVTSPDVARIYVMRAGQTMGSVRSLVVEEANEAIGALGQGEYLCWERAPGRTLLTFVYEGPRIDGGDREGIHSLDAEAGGVYYLMVHLDAQPGAEEQGIHAGQPQVEVLDAAAGREKVRERHAVPVR